MKRTKKCCSGWEQHELHLHPNGRNVQAEVIVIRDGAASCGRDTHLWLGDKDGNYAGVVCGQQTLRKLAHAILRTVPPRPTHPARTTK